MYCALWTDNWSAKNVISFLPVGCVQIITDMTIYIRLSLSLTLCSSRSSGLHPEQSTFLQVWIWIWIKIRLDGTNFQFAILFATGVAQRIMLLTFVINIVTSVLVDVLWHAATSTTETDWAKNAGVRWMTKKWEYRCRSTVLIYLCSNATNDNKPTNFIFAFWSDFTHFPAPTQSAEKTRWFWIEAFSYFWIVPLRCSIARAHAHSPSHHHFDCRSFDFTNCIIVQKRWLLSAHGKNTHRQRKVNLFLL